MFRRPWQWISGDAASGNGDGTFGAASTVLANYVVNDVKVADMNQDGKPDILLAVEEVQGNDVSTGA